MKEDNMKQGWEIKKLGEVCEVLNGYAFDSNLFTDDNTCVPIIRIRDIKRGYTETFYKGEYAQEYIINKGNYLIGMDGEFNIAEWSGKDSLLNQRVCKLSVVSSELMKRFVLWYMSIALKQIEDETPFVTVKHLSSKKLLNIPIPVPPLPVQERIVSELDLLSGIIEKKREQLKEFDALAQSIFYDMFGDPITNEKGWEVKKLGEVADIVGGSTPKTNIKEYWNGDNYWVTPAELHGTRYISSTERCITDLAVDKAHLTQLPIGTVLLSSRAPIGKVCITRVPMYCNQGFKNIICSNKLNSEYVYQYLIDKTEFLKSLGTGATFKEISKTTTENITIPIPPLPLQRQFASKIEAIEKQKELIKQSISETETLFNARMQEHFG